MHAILEVSYLNLLIINFSKYNLGLSWENWYLIYYIIAIILLFISLMVGFLQGKYWWKRLYM